MKSNPCVRTCRKRDEKAKQKHLATNAIKSISQILHLHIGNFKRKTEDIKEDDILKIQT